MMRIMHRSILVHFGGILGAMGILTRLRLAKIQTTARTNSPDMQPKCNEMVRLGIVIIHDTSVIKTSNTARNMFCTL